MASLAGLCRLRGHRITGSDKAAYPPHERSVCCADGHRSDGTIQPKRILNPRRIWSSSGNALSRGNPEIERVLESGFLHSEAGLLHEEFPQGARVRCGGRHARQDDDHQHAGVDLSGRAREPHCWSLHSHRRRAENSARASNSAPPAPSSSSDESTPPSSTGTESHYFPMG